MTLKKVFRINKEYFSEYENEIAQRNLKLMRTVCYCGITLFTIYYIITYFFFRDRMISLYYTAFIPVLAIFLVVIRQSLKKSDISFKKAQALTILMYIVVMVYCIVMSVPVHPDLYSVYYPLFLVLGPVMFILPMYQQLLINTLSYAAFFLMVVNIKPDTLWMHDLFESFTALMFSVVVILLMTQFRVQSDSLKNKYYSLSRLDGLTGLLNKTTGSELIQSYIESNTRKEPYCLILLDVDDFKNINDTYGHENGDSVLKSLGQLLPSAFRRDDIVSRYGGDEFLILMKNMPRENCESVLIGLEKDIVCLTVNESDEIKISFSMGVYTGICGDIGFNDALKNADTALYTVKLNGKSAYRFHQRAEADTVKIESSDS